ncbi:MAG: hypothetical protein RLN96_07205 [Pseudomonadales bacterium]
MAKVLGILRRMLSTHLIKKPLTPLPLTPKPLCKYPFFLNPFPYLTRQINNTKKHGNYPDEKPGKYLSLSEAQMRG